MRSPALLAVALGIATMPGATGAAKPAVEHIYGPPPDWATYRKLAEAAVAGRLIDPDSARIAWLGGYRKDVFKPLLAPRVAGYFACGTVNARNRMGGYAGATAFVTVIDYDRVLYADIDSRPGGLLDGQCAQALRAGLLPPVPADAGTAPGAATASGLTLRAMPDGAYVGAVAAGSPAAIAGLKPGMVIASVNAIPLAGMGEAMLAVLAAAAPGATLTLIGGTSLTLSAAR